MLTFCSIHTTTGVILGTPGAGNGLDHANMRDVLASIEDKRLMIFLHPHYGVGKDRTIMIKTTFSLSLYLNTNIHTRT